LHKKLYPHYSNKHLTHIKPADWKIGGEPHKNGALSDVSSEVILLKNSVLGHA